MKRRDADEGHKHAIGGAVYSLHPAYGKHVPCLICACHKHFVGATWEEAGADFDAHLDGEDVPDPPKPKAVRARARRR